MTIDRARMFTVPLIAFMYSALLPAAPPLRKALIIGNSVYPTGVLRNAARDARDISASLDKLGYQTMLKMNTSRKGMEQAVDFFTSNLEPADVALIYYSGHGMQVNGENFLVPTDFTLTDDNSTTLKERFYALSSLIENIQRRRVGMTVVILDACRDNPFAKSSRSAAEGWAAISASMGTFIAFATAPGSTASDNPTELNGLFTKALLKYIGSSLGFNELFEKVRKEVIEGSNGRQVPWTASSLITTVHFDPKLDVGLVNLRDSVAIAAANEGAAEAFLGSNSGRSVGSESPALPDSDDEATARLLIQQALTLVNHENLEEGVRSLSAAASFFPESSIALRILGLVFHLLGQRSASLEELNKAVTVNPADYRAFFYRCLVQASSDPPSAIRDCESSLGLMPSFAMAHVGLADAWLSGGNVDRAYSEAVEAVRLLPDCSFAYTIRAKTELQLGRLAQSQRDFSRAASFRTAK